MMAPARFDVIVVGGGPAGSSSARALVQAGLRVVVIDGARFPRDKPCAGWITPAVVRSLELDLAEYGRTRVCQPITGFRTGRMGASLRETRFGAAVSYGICRLEFDDYLVRRSGAVLVQGTPVTALRRDGGAWVVNDTFTAPVIVGAGGHRCPVARHLGAHPANELAVAAQEVEFTLTERQASQCRIAPDTPQLMFCRDLKGYGWCVRKGDRLNVGLGRLDPHHLPAHVRAFRDALIAEGVVPPDMPERWKGHAYLLRNFSPRAVIADGALLVGDAAGLAVPISGEGIRPAVESGLAAARVVVEAGGRYDVERLRGYAEWLDAHAPRGRHAVLERLPQRLVKAVMGRVIDVPWFTRHVLLERWFLQTSSQRDAA